MTKNVETSLKRIQTLTRTLNESSDLLSQKIGEVESALNQYKLGIRVWLEQPLLEETYYAPAQWQKVHQLGYSKLDGKWGFLVNVYPDYDPDSGTTTFLRDAPRELRLKAVDKIPDLLEHLADEAAKLNESVTDKAKLAEKMAVALGRQGN